MTSWNTIESRTARDLFVRLRTLDWSWRVAEVSEVVSQLGWTVALEDPGRGAIVDTGLGLGGEEAIFGYDGDRVDNVNVTVTEIVPGETAEARAFLHDAFATLVAVARDAFGPPTRTELDDLPAAVWIDDRTALSVIRGDGTVFIVLRTAERQAHWDEIDQELLA